MSNPILSKLFALGLSAAVGGAGLFAGTQAASTAMEGPRPR